MHLRRFLILLLVGAFSCRSADSVQSEYTAFKGATIIDGSGEQPIQNAVLLIRHGRVVAVGTEREVSVPAGVREVDVTGKTIVPGIINGHGHVGNTRGIEGGHYSAENIIDNLKIYARYGVTTVVSLGDDKKDAVPLRHVNTGTAFDRARLFIAGAVISGETPEQALAVIDSNDHMGVDFMKIRVDDNLGTSKKMSEDIYSSVIKRSHDLGYKIATHMYYLEDATKLLDAGSDLLAHSVRDLPVDDQFINLILEKKVGYCPTLTRELSAFVYSDTPDFFEDPFFTREYDATAIEPLKDPTRQSEISNSQSAMMYRRQLPVAMANLKKLSDAGVPIVFGTDSGVPTRFMGYFEHLEMEMMEQAGLTPMEIIVSATKNPAEYMGLDSLGTLTEGHWADFLVLDANPMEGIKNLRKINAVYIGGAKVARVKD